MDWDVKFQGDNILVLSVRGEFSSGRLRSMVEQLISNQRWRPEKNIIIDFRELIVDKINIDDIYSSLDIHRQFDGLISGKIAVINKDHSGHGLSSLYEEISRQYIKSKYASFISFEDAFEWISER